MLSIGIQLKAQRLTIFIQNTISITVCVACISQQLFRMLYIVGHARHLSVGKADRENSGSRLGIALVDDICKGLPINRRGNCLSYAVVRQELVGIIEIQNLGSGACIAGYRNLITVHKLDNILGRQLECQIHFSIIQSHCLCVTIQDILDGDRIQLRNTVPVILVCHKLHLALFHRGNHKGAGSHRNCVFSFQRIHIQNRTYQIRQIIKKRRVYIVGGDGKSLSLCFNRSDIQHGDRSLIFLTGPIQAGLGSLSSQFLPIAEFDSILQSDFPGQIIYLLVAVCQPGLKLQIVIDTEQILTYPDTLGFPAARGRIQGFYLRMISHIQMLFSCICLCTFRRLLRTLLRVCHRFFGTTTAYQHGCAQYTGQQHG